MREKYSGLTILILGFGVASCSANRIQCSNLDNIQINPKETVPLVENAQEMSKGIFLSKYTDLLDRRLSNYLFSGMIPNEQDNKYPFCAKVTQILTTTQPNDREAALLQLKRNWLNHFENEATGLIKHNPTIPVAGCDHVILPMVEAYLRKTEGDPSGFYALKPQYDECIALSLATSNQSSKNVKLGVTNEP